MRRLNMRLDCRGLRSLYDVKAANVKDAGNYILEISFENGKKGMVDFSGYAMRGGVFSGFADIEYFKRVSIDPVWGVLVWPGDVDIAPETIYRLATGKEADECAEKVTRI